MHKTEQGWNSRCTKGWAPLSIDTCQMNAVTALSHTLPVPSVSVMQAAEHSGCVVSNLQDQAAIRRYGPMSIGGDTRTPMPGG
jgi:hypothetical protein